MRISFAQGSELKEEDDVDKWMSQRKEAKNAKVMDWEAHAVGIWDDEDGVLQWGLPGQMLVP